VPHDERSGAVAPAGLGSRFGELRRLSRGPGARARFTPYSPLLTDKPGHIVGAINLLADISARKSAEIELSRLHAIARVERMLASIVMGPGHPIGPQNDENTRSCLHLARRSGLGKRPWRRQFGVQRTRWNEPLVTHVDPMQKWSVLKRPTAPSLGTRAKSSRIALEARDGHNARWCAFSY